MTLRRILIGGGILLVLAMVIALAFLVGVLYGRGGQQQGAEQAVAETTQEQQAETTQEQQAENTEQKTAPKSNETSSNVAVAGLGETVTFADRTLTVNDIQRGYIFPSNIPKPTPGNEFIIANVTLTNTSSQPIPANSYNFESEDSTGARVRAQATKVPPDAIYLGTIAANGEQTGNLVFEVQQGDPTIRIVYRPGP